MQKDARLDTENAFYYDEELKQWRERGAPPPPPAVEFAPPPMTSRPAAGAGAHHMTIMPPTSVPRANRDCRHWPAVRLAQCHDASCVMVLMPWHNAATPPASDRVPSSRRLPALAHSCAPTQACLDQSTLAVLNQA